MIFNQQLAITIVDKLLIGWYGAGGALFLSFNAAGYFFRAKKLLAGEDVNFEDLRRTPFFASNRAQIRLRYVRREEADTGIAEAG